MLWSMIYKEFLELKSDRRTIAELVLLSVGTGLLLPIVMYLRLAGILPAGITGTGLEGEELVALIRNMMETVFPLLLPFFISVMATDLAIPSIVRETESRTLERLLSLPFSWRNIFFGKFLFHFGVSLACAYIIVSIYFLLSSAVVEGFQPPCLVAYLLVLVPAVVFYTVSAGLFASARARTMTAANLLGRALTSGLFFGAFVLTWAIGVEPGRDLILGFGLVLFLIGLMLAYFTARVNPQKLLYGRGS